MFLDEAIITVHAGNGGNGAVSWRREKYVPKGGPDGGDGGRGGHVVFRADRNTDTLSDFASRKVFDAPPGAAGSGANKHGRNGKDLELSVPPGTIITLLDEQHEPISTLADLREHGVTVTVACGGRGGYGNAHFVSSVRQRPDFAELGEPGEEQILRLELKLVADVGLIGYPSVGKSTLISVLTHARPKIAAYPFTTLVPNLGVAQVHDRQFVLCDVPGLIEGASDGKGLGITFLKHIERTGVLVHMLDIGRALGENGEVSVDALLSDYRAIRTELERYSPTLAAKRELVVLHKSDLINHETSDLELRLRASGIDTLLSLSAVTQYQTQTLLDRLLPIVLEERSRRDIAAIDSSDPTLPLPVLRPQEETQKMHAYRVEIRTDGSLLVRGKRLEQFTKMTNFQHPGAINRFRNVVERIGLRTALRQHGMNEETRVFIGSVPVHAYL